MTFVLKCDDICPLSSKLPLNKLICSILGLILQSAFLLFLLLKKKKKKKKEGKKL